MDQDLIRAGFAAAIGAAVIGAEAEDFAIGARDCAFWIADIDLAMFGVDPAAPYRRRFHDVATRRGVLGWRELPGAMMETAKRMGWRPIDPRAGQIGDRGLLKRGGVWIAAIFDGQFWLARVDRGIAGFAGAAVQRAWSPC